MILVDSSVWIDYFRGIATAACDKLDCLLGNQPLAIGDLIMAGVLQGFRTDGDFHSARKLLSTLVFVELAGQDITVQAAKNYRVLRALGITPRKTIDTIIATRCIKDGFTLLHSDRGFDPFVKHLGLCTVLF